VGGKPHVTMKFEMFERSKKFDSYAKR